VPASLAYYNENDAKAAAWLRELIKAGHIAPGDVDDRSIEDIKPSDLDGYTQCHFFAGIGGWSYALRLAGWDDARPVWTGSCPCQPFSAAGKGAGFADERHLWPAWFHLIRAIRPQQIFGEQVAKALPWLDLVQGDLEAENYTTGAAIIGAHSVGAPHIRQRLYWVAESQGEQHDRRGDARRGRGELADGGRDGGVGNASCTGSWWHSGAVPSAEGSAKGDVWGVPDESFITGPDGKRRPIKPGLEPLVNGLPGRVGLLRGYGNAIVPQAAAIFIKASQS
jgi:DNA (cytosine-5)-methyltransferase 1